MFELHPQLGKDCITVGDFPLCRLLLSNDSHYPWFVLVPRREGVTEVFELDEADQLQLQRESIHLSRVIYDAFDADKLNVAALGNMVSQLHVHHIVRYRGDAAWPAPVWGKFPATRYDSAAVQAVLEPLRGALSHGFKFAESIL
ncbi:HIT domain-containing protein [Halopseudomonas sabulinigri]|uniref:HIT domain-containing protein n=1 Tax=Halopseudomonas sabulinigri TaxID=472181 RepID=A0ABP9ZQT8_9GAMM